MVEATQEPRGWDLSSTCRGLQEAAKAHARRIAHAETGAQALAQVLSAQARGKFGADHPPGQALLDALAAARAVEPLKQLGAKLLEAPDWGAWLAGVEAPPPAPDDSPEYSNDEDIDLEPEQPFIELTMQTGAVAGKKLIIQCRLQKWYQPEIGEVLYHEARRLEKRFKIPVQMVVMLMWPSADGPNVTGRYRAIDPLKRKIDFRYEVRRAWEMPPEEMLNSISTMMMIPLAKGAKQRMPELIRSMRERLARRKKPRDHELAWTAFYWAMGMVCTLEEANALLGDLLPLVQGTKDYKKAYGHAFQRGYGPALAEGPLLAVRELIGLQAKQRFGDDPARRTALDSVNTLPALKAIAGRVATATDWANLIGG